MANKHNTSQGTSASIKSFVVFQNAAAELRQRFREDRGATMVEYGLLLSSALLIAFAVVMVFGQRVIGLFESVDTEFQNVRPTTP